MKKLVLIITILFSFQSWSQTHTNCCPDTVDPSKVIPANMVATGDILSHVISIEKFDEIELADWSHEKCKKNQFELIKQMKIFISQAQVINKDKVKLDSFKKALKHFAIALPIYMIESENVFKPAETYSGKICVNNSSPSHKSMSPKVIEPFETLEAISRTYSLSLSTCQQFYQTEKDKEILKLVTSLLDLYSIKPKP